MAEDWKECPGRCMTDIPLNAETMAIVKDLMEAQRDQVDSMQRLAEKHEQAAKEDKTVKVYTLNVSECQECPYYAVAVTEDLGRKYYICKLMGRLLSRDAAKQTVSIPAWCILDDV